MLAIEVDGGYHLTKEQVDYDQERTMELEKLEITVIRFTNDQVFNHLSVVLGEISLFLDASLGAR